MTLTLQLRSSPPGHVDATALTGALEVRTAAAAARIRLRCGRDSPQVGELFDVAGQGDGDVVLTGDLRRLHRVGRGMQAGRLLVEGSLGDGTGEDMRGGVLTVRGDVGDRLGAAQPGARSGMTGGEIVVTGDAGAEAGAGLRRGLVAVGGRAGDGTGLRMLAGTVVALGGIGRESGLGNKRGSIVCAVPTTPLVTYTFATHLRPPALALQLRRLRVLGLAVDDALVTGRWARWSGDGLELNRGELLIYQP